MLDDARRASLIEMDHKAELMLLAERAQTADDPMDLLELATDLYGLARLIDMKGVLQKARTVRIPSVQVVH